MRGGDAPRTTRRYHGLRVVLITLIMLVAYIGLPRMDLLQGIEGQLLDWRFSLRGERLPGEDVIIVAVDDATLNEYGRWPLSRRWLGKAISRLSEAGAAAIAIDFLFFGAEETGGTNSTEGDADRALGRAIAEAGNVVVPFAFSFDPSETGTTSGLPPILQESAYRVTRSPGGDAPRLLGHPNGVLIPILPVLRAGHPAHVNVFVEEAGSLRHGFPVIGFGGSYFPSLAVEAVRILRGLDRGELGVVFGEGVRIGDSFLPTDSAMRWSVNYYGADGAFPRYSMSDVIAGDVPDQAFAGKIVLLGGTALGLGDTFSTPFSQSMPGIEYFATVIENILDEGFLRHDAGTRGIDALVILAMGTLIALAAMLRHPVLDIALTGLIVVAVVVINVIAFRTAGVWLNLTFPLTLGLVRSAYVAWAVASREYRQRLVVETERQNLSQYFSPALVERIARGRASDDLRRPIFVAVMFIDLKGFTGLAEHVGPHRSATILQEFHRIVEQDVEAHGGLVDKFMGDGALVVFGIPGTSPDDALNALRCALTLKTSIAPWAKERNISEGAPPIGIGLHYGAVVFDESGGTRQRHATVTGDTVNVASRLEGLTREQEAWVVASDALMEAARAAADDDAPFEGFQRLPMQEIRGRERPIGVWALT